MKQTDFLVKGIALLGVLSVTTIDCALAPTNAGCFLVGVKRWEGRLWLSFVAARRESRGVPEEFAIIVKETQASR
jgi:hypothetical protein